jgi:hypothetical protein
MATYNLKLYDIVRLKLNLTEADAKEFALAIDEEVQNHISRSASDYNSTFREDILKLEMSLKGEIKDSKLDVYKAIFITGVVQLLAILGGVLAIVKFMQ